MSRWWPGLCLAVMLLLAATCSPRPEPLSGVVAGSQEVVLLGTGEVEPLLIGAPEAPLELCVDLSSRDLKRSRKAQITFGELPPGEDGFRDGVLIGSGITCFEVQGEPPYQQVGKAAQPGEPADQLAEILEQSSFRICGWLSGESFEKIPCVKVHYQRDSTRFEQLRKQADRYGYRICQDSLSENECNEEIEERKKGLEDFLEVVRAEFPLLEFFAKASLVRVLRHLGTVKAIQEAELLLEETPDWLSEPAASRALGNLQLARAEIELRALRLEEAWSLFEQARDTFMLTGADWHLWAENNLAVILERVGDSEAAEQRRVAALDKCEAGARCVDHLLAAMRGALGWQLLLDPDVDAEKLTEAESKIKSAIELTSQRLEEQEELTEVQLTSIQRNQAIHLANLAYCQALMGQDPSLAIERMGAYAPQFSDSIHIARGTHELKRGKFQEAIRLCELGSRTGSAQERAMALGCVGQGQRQLGRLNDAYETYQKLLRSYEFESQLGLAVPLGVGLRAEAYFRAARVAIERGEPEAAWDLLSQLDRLSLTEVERRRCREAATDPEIVAAWSALDRKERRVRVRLADASGPVARSIEDAVETERRDLEQQLEQLLLQIPGCQSSEATEDRNLRFRAFALDDEVILLRQDSDGQIALHQRKQVSRQSIRDSVIFVEEALGERNTLETSWREELSYLSDVLVPEGLEALEDRLSFALHGVLQGVPLAAIPLREGRWFGELKTIVLRPVGSAAERGNGKPAAQPYFAVDPLENLDSASSLLETYRQLYPEATTDFGATVKRERFKQQLTAARWLHIDAHGVFRKKSPSLSYFKLADGDLIMEDLLDVEMGLEFANLSGCQTGRWPTTADSGRYGFAGMFARSGVPWIIATRSDLVDEVASDFNTAFYTSLGDLEGNVPAAYGAAMAQLREDREVTQWAALFLLQGPAPQGAR